MVEILYLCTNTAESELPRNEVKALLEITVCFEIASFFGTTVGAARWFSV